MKIKPNCKYCASDNVVRWGKSGIYGEYDCFKCKPCNRRFVIGKKDPWIPCSERLPTRQDTENAGYRFLITIKDTTADRAHEVRITKEAHFNVEDQKFHFGGVFPSERVIAWMPLPEPWRGDV